MRNLLLCSFLFALYSCNERKEASPASAKNKAADQLVSYYNRQQYDSIFHLFSPAMKEALPLKSTVDFFAQMQNDAGAIAKHKWIDKKQNADRYRTDFSKGIYWMSITVNEKEIDGLYFKEYDGPGVEPSMIRNTTKLTLPFKGEWFVFWGGDTKAQNYHVISRSQKNAFDLVIVDKSNKSFRTNGKKNEDYYAFGQPISAPCDANVVSVIEGIKDNIPGEMNPDQVTGNTIVLKTSNKEYLLFAHFKLNSIKVKVGDSVKKGDLLGLCGNSGNSSEPHLHFHIQDKESMIGSTGIKCYFEKLLVNGEIKTDYSPIRGDRIKTLINK